MWRHAGASVASCPHTQDIGPRHESVCVSTYMRMRIDICVCVSTWSLQYCICYVVVRSGEGLMSLLALPFAFQQHMLSTCGDASSPHNVVDSSKTAFQTSVMSCLAPPPTPGQLKQGVYITLAGGGIGVRCLQPSDHRLLCILLHPSRHQPTAHGAGTRRREEGG